MNRTLLTVIYDFLFGTTDAARQKRLLKNVAKQLRHKGYVYYNPRKDTLLPSFADLLFDIYRVAGTMRPVFDKIKSPEILTSYIIRFAVSDTVRAAMDSIDVNQIRMDAGNVPYAALYKSVKQNAGIVKSFFTAEEMARINNICTGVMVFRELCMFDYFFLLKKFNPALQEKSLPDKPEFNNEYGANVVDQIEDFAGIAAAFAKLEQLDTVLDCVVYLNSGNEIPANEFNRIWKILHEYEEDAVLENVCCLIRKDPKLTPRPYSVPKDICGKWAADVLEMAGRTLKDIYDDQKKKKIAEAVSSVFSEQPAQYLKQYTKTLGDRLAEHKLGGFRYTEPLNYVYAFLQTDFMKETDQFIQVLTIKGRTVSPDALKSLFEDYYQLRNVLQHIDTLEGKLVPNCQLGYKFEKVLKGKNVEEDIRMDVVRDIDLVNAEAAGILRTASVIMRRISPALKTLADDAGRKPGEIMANWSEIDHAFGKSSASVIVAAVSKMSMMCRLLDTYIIAEPEGVKQ